MEKKKSISVISQHFETRCSLIKILPKRPSDDDLLYLYGMYKQAKIGDCNTKEPNSLNIKDYSKWVAWNNNKGIDTHVAMAFYVSKVDDLFMKQQNQE
tara:strand:- start:1338 stop:1631 length:294 start_codon:yes stop_codon:yes gene_type:complete